MYAPTFSSPTIKLSLYFNSDYCWRSRSVYLGSVYILSIYLSSEYSVQLDTGSSDLWIKGDVHPLPGTTTMVSFDSETPFL